MRPGRPHDAHGGLVMGTRRGERPRRLHQSRTRILSPSHVEPRTVATLVIHPFNEVRGHLMTSNLNRVLAGVALLLGVAPQALRAQQATVISGRVVNQQQLPVTNASVSIPTLNLGTYTTSEGRYSFSVPSTYTGRTVTLTARRIGFQPQSVEISLSGSPVTHDFSLTTSATQLEVVVTTA